MKLKASVGRRQLASGRLAAALVALELIVELLTFVNGAERRALDRRDVDEHVAAARVRRDEAEALGRVEPLNRSGSH